MSEQRTQGPYLFFHLGGNFRQEGRGNVHFLPGSGGNVAYNLVAARAIAQALGYKIGEIKIRELRALAEKELGPQFNLSAFHDTILGQGAVPLDVLEIQVKDWIAKVKSQA